MMRAYTLSVLQNCTNSKTPATDAEIIAWVNEKVDFSFFGFFCVVFCCVKMEAKRTESKLLGRARFALKGPKV